AGARDDRQLLHRRRGAGGGGRRGSRSVRRGAGAAVVAGLVSLIDHMEERTLEVAWPGGAAPPDGLASPSRYGREPNASRLEAALQTAGPPGTPERIGSAGHAASRRRRSLHVEEQHLTVRARACPGELSGIGLADFVGLPDQVDDASVAV